MSGNIPWYSEQFYHVYNRGHNRKRIFFQERNYQFFLERISEYVIDYLEVLAFVLIPNHFHVIVKIKSKEEIQRYYQNLYPGRSDVGVNNVVSQAFSNMFNSYIKSINRQENKTGTLFGGKCQRKLLKSEEYLSVAIMYTHYNPLKHHVARGISEYRWSSYPIFLSDEPSGINRMLVFELFHGKDNFLTAHKNFVELSIEKKVQDFWIE